MTDAEIDRHLLSLGHASGTTPETVRARLLAELRKREPEDYRWNGIRYFVRRDGTLGVEAEAAGDRR